MSIKVGAVQQIGGTSTLLLHGFCLQDSNGPIITLAFGSLQEAEDARSRMEALLGSAAEVTVQRKPAP